VRNNCMKMCGSRRGEILNIEIQKQRDTIVYLMRWRKLH
jgi:predicted nucleic acid-binding Zn ribbon protein